MKEDMIFEYVLSDAWGMPLLDIELNKSEHGYMNITEYGDCGEITESTHNIEITDASMSKIEKAISEFDFNAVKKLEFPPVLDGFMQEFFFKSKDASYVIRGYNLDYCVGDPEQFPKANAVIDLFSDIAEELISNGVSEKYFILAPRP